MCFHQINRSTVVILLWSSISALDGKGLKDVFSFQMSPQATSTWCHAQHVARELRVKLAYSRGTWRYAIQCAAHVVRCSPLDRNHEMNRPLHERSRSCGQVNLCAISGSIRRTRRFPRSLSASSSTHRPRLNTMSLFVLLLCTTSISIWTKLAMYV